MTRWQRLRAWIGTDSGGDPPAAGRSNRARPTRPAADQEALAAASARLDAPLPGERLHAIRLLAAAARTDPAHADRVRQALVTFLRGHASEPMVAQRPADQRTDPRGETRRHCDRSGDDVRAAIETLATLRPRPGAEPGRLQLHGVDLRCAALERLDLRAFDLAGADLRAAKLGGARLRGVVLRGARLRGADLRRTDLAAADLTSADLGEAHLRGADLSASTLDGADLHGAHLEDVNLERAQLVACDLRHAQLRGSDLRCADLRRADLHQAGLQAADLTGADLRGSDLEHAELWGANLDGADLEGANLTHAELYRVRSWHSIRSLVAARVSDVVDPPEGFVDWATGTMHADAGASPGPDPGSRRV